VCWDDRTSPASLDEYTPPDPGASGDALLSRGRAMINSAAYFAEDKNVRFEMVKQDIASRLKKVCSNFTDEDFAILVERMAWTQIRSESRSR
jgi:hypothetical protein